jgi:hypothetical protein
MRKHHWAIIIGAIVGYYFSGTIGSYIGAGTTSASNGFSL